MSRAELEESLSQVEDQIKNIQSQIDESREQIKRVEYELEEKKIDLQDAKEAHDIPLVNKLVQEISNIELDTQYARENLEQLESLLDSLADEKQNIQDQLDNIE